MMRYEIQKGNKGFALIDLQEKMVIDCFGKDEQTANGICKSLNECEETEHIKRALNAAGYVHADPTRDNLVECYLDYATAYGGDIDDLLDDINCEIITDNQMCNALIKCN